MDTKEHQYKCEICLKNYKTKTTLSRHICKIVDDNIICKHCDKVFKNKYNRKHHELNCKKLPSEYLLDENKKLKRIILEMKNSNILTTIKINPNSFGNEDISHITKSQIINAFKMCKYFPLEMIKLTHFNNNKPENHNIYKPNFKDKYVKYFMDDDWKIGEVKKFVTELYMNIMDFAEEKFIEYKEYLSDITKERFQWVLDNREHQDITTEIFKKIVEMLYNERNIVSIRG